MTTIADTLSAAIQTLEHQKAAATPGPWDFEFTDESIEINAGTARTTWKGTTGVPARSWKTTDRILSVDVEDLDFSEAEQIAANAELIVTLHGTIDAQLRFLREGLINAVEHNEKDLDFEVYLARSILGEKR